MADALGLAVNVVAVIQLAKEISVATYKYTKAYKNAPQEIASLRTELGALVMVLEILPEEAKDSDIDAVKSNLHASGGPLWLCKDVLQSIIAKLGKDKEKIEGLKRILWPFKEDEMKEHLQKLERAKSILELSMTADQSILTREVQKLCLETQSKATETLESVRKIEERQISNEERQALNWLNLDGRLDYRMNHTAARELHQAGTGEWFIDGSLFKEWLSGGGKHIWLHGIPGAGKTILMSTIIATATERIQTIPERTATAYFYFSFRDPLKQTASNMLSSILAQLCHDITPFPTSLMSFKARSDKLTGRPDCDELLKEIETVCALVDRAYIFLDALDECERGKEQSRALNGLRRLSATSNVRLIITSRKEQDLEQMLRALPFECVSIQTKAVNHDIKAFLEKLLQEDAQLRRLNENPRIKGKILDTLVSGAQGM